MREKPTSAAAVDRQIDCFLLGESGSACLKPSLAERRIAAGAAPEQGVSGSSSLRPR